MMATLSESICDKCTWQNDEPPMDCNNLHKYYTGGSIASIVGASIVMVTYILESKLREHPSVLIFSRCIFDVGLAVSFIVLDTFDINDIACKPDICQQLGAINLFFFLCSILFYGALQFDLFLSINNPFSNPENTVNRMHLIIIIVSLTTTLVTRSEYSFVYRTDLQYCSLSPFSNNNGSNDINPYSTALLYVPILSVMLISFIITIYSCRRLRGGLPGTFYVRRKAIFDAWVYSLIFMVYVSVVGITYFINWEQQRLENSSNYNVTMLYALSSTTMGVVDCLVWFLTIYVHRKFDFSNDHVNYKNDKLKKQMSSRRIPTPVAPYDISIDTSSDSNECINDVLSRSGTVSFSWKDKKRNFKRCYKRLCKNIGIKPTKSMGTMINVTLRRELLAYTTDGIAQSVKEIMNNKEFERKWDIPNKDDYPKGINDKTSNTVYISNVMIQHNWALLQIEKKPCKKDIYSVSQYKRVNPKDCCPSIFGSGVSRLPINSISDHCINMEPKQKLIQISASKEENEMEEKRDRASSIINVQEPDQLINKNRKFVTYAPIIFRYIRHIILNMSDDDYIKSIIPTEKEDQIRVLDHAKSGGGQSGAFFYFTHDKRFIVKTIKKHELQHLVDILKDYVAHLTKYASTILCRCIGLHSLTIYGKTQYYMIMENVFLSKQFQPQEKYDLKGSWIGRYTNYGLHSGRVMKDVDLKRYVILSKKKKIGVMKQLDVDTKFLSSHQIMDYSLLLGIYHMKIEQDDDDDSNDSDDDKYEYNAEEYDQYTDDVKSNLSESYNKNINDNSIDVTNINIHDDVYSQGVRAQIIEGPGIYYFGIIDALQKYSLRKRFETWFRKWIQRKDVRGISCIPPDEYRERFMRYMNAIFIADKKYKRKYNLLDKKFEKEQLRIYPPKQLVKKNMKNIKKTRHGSLSFLKRRKNSGNEFDNMYDYMPPIPKSMPQTTSLPALYENKASPTTLHRNSVLLFTT